MTVRPRRLAQNAELNINSMMDMMTILLVFLLKSYSTTDVSVAPADTLQLPTSSAITAPPLAVNLMVSRDQVLVDGVAVVALTRTSEGGVDFAPELLRGQSIPRLYDVLSEKASAATDTPLADFSGEVLIQADRSVPYEVLRRVIHTAGQARFGRLRFVVIGEGG